MAKGGRTLNPADAQRKAERKKEVNKNKANRSKARELSTVKKDTRGLEADISKLEGDKTSGKLDKNGFAQLASLREELEHIKNVKDNYVKEHPEHAKLVRPTGEARERKLEGSGPPLPIASRSLFGPNGLPLHPERSIYYDPIMNPYGVPPPGMPYVERPLLPHELPQQPVASGSLNDAVAEDEASDSDDEIPLPPGPPPIIDVEDAENDDEDIPLPQGPPPATHIPGPIAIPELPPHFVPPLPPGPPPPLLPPGLPAFVSQLPPPPPLGFNVISGALPPPPPGFPVRSHISHAFPPPPPPPHRGFGTAPQDPLSDRPHRPYQDHRNPQQNPITIQSLPPLPLSLPPRPGLPPPPLGGPPIVRTTTTIPIQQSVAVISAEPQLRDLKRESTAFVPTAVKKRKVTATQEIKARVNAAPHRGEDDHDGTSGGTPESPASRPDLMGTLRGAGIGIGPVLPTPSTNSKAKAPDDYDNFLNEMSDILGNDA